MEATSTPRITSQYLDNYVGRNVMIVGKVVQLRGDTAVVDADGNVTAHLNRVSFPPPMMSTERREPASPTAASDNDPKLTCLRRMRTSLSAMPPSLSGR